MNGSCEWHSLIDDGYTLRPVEESIFGVLPDGPHDPLYDRRAAWYDVIVGSRVYNRVMWGASMRDYVAFANQATTSHRDGTMLDIGCGSLLFTARAYVECQRPIIAFDQSLRMLRQARSRLRKLAGRVPDHILLVQADLTDLPFRAG